MNESRLLVSFPLRAHISLLQVNLPILVKHYFLRQFRKVPYFLNDPQLKFIDNETACICAANGASPASLLGVLLEGEEGLEVEAVEVQALSASNRSLY